MEIPPPPASGETPAPLPAVPAPTTPPPPAGIPIYRRPAAIVAAVALVVVVLQWYDSRVQVGALQQELARRLAESDAQAKESRNIAEQVREATREAQVKLGVLEAKLQESQSQQLALEALYQELSRSRDESVLADVEQTLLVANQQLQVAGNVRAALIALQAADARLARVDRPQLASLRKAIARDIQRLELAPQVDVIGISARLDNLVNAVDAMPLAMEVRPPEPQRIKPGTAEADGSWWARFTRELWRDVRDLVRIQNLERPEMPLLTPAQTYFLRENLKLRLLGARLALLAHDERSFKDDLRAARDWLTRYYDARDKSVANALGTVRQLGDSQIRIDLPDVSASLDAVRAHRQTRERGR